LSDEKRNAHLASRQHKCPPLPDLRALDLRSVLSTCGERKKTQSRYFIEFLQLAFIYLCFYKSLLWFLRTPPPLRRTPSYALVLDHLGTSSAESNLQCGLMMEKTKLLGLLGGGVVRGDTELK